MARKRLNPLFNAISDNINIGAGTLVAQDCMLLTGVHRFIDGLRADLHGENLVETCESGNDITIGKGRLVGSGVTILANTAIDDNVIIGAGSVVNKDIPSNCLVAGVPARMISS
jgi:acetyltransferase-like isoleucine patch superfamily enzyme